VCACVSFAYRYRPAGAVGTSAVAVLTDSDMTSTRGSVLLARPDRRSGFGPRVASTARQLHGSAVPRR
jgi:hypothetical protein